MQRLGVPRPALQQRLIGCERLRELAVTVQLECALEREAGMGLHAVSALREQVARTAKEPGWNIATGRKLHASSLRSKRVLIRPKKESQLRIAVWCRAGTAS